MSFDRINQLPIVGDGIRLRPRSFIPVTSLKVGFVPMEIAAGQRYGRMIGKSRPRKRNRTAAKTPSGALRIIVRRLRAQVHKPTGVDAVDRQIACHILAQIRRRKPMVRPRSSPCTTAPSTACGCPRIASASLMRLAQQVAHIRGAPHAHGLPYGFSCSSARRSALDAFQRIGRLTMVGGHNRLRIGWHAGFARSTIVDHVNNTPVASARFSMAFTSPARFAPMAASDPSTGARMLAHHLSKEESVRFRRERQRVTHDERVIHRQLVDGAHAPACW